MPENPLTEEVLDAREEAYLRPAAKPTVDSRKFFLSSLLLVLALFPVLQIVSGQFNYWLHMLLFTFMNITMAASWNIIGGYTGYISLGHNVFSGMGGYVAGALLVFYGLSPFLTAPLAGAFAFLLGLLVGLITLRTRGSAFIIATSALVLLAKLGLDNLELLGGTNGVSLPLPPLPARVVKLPFYYGMLLTAVGAVYTSYRIRHSKFGLGLRAIAQDETKAEVAGIPTSQYKILAFAISAFFPGMAGALWAYYLTYLRPTIYFAVLGAAEVVLMTLLGGRGTVSGPVLGAALLVILNEFFVAKFGSTELNIAGTGLLMLLVLLFFPDGIVGTLRKRRKLPRFLDWG